MAFSFFGCKWLMPDKDAPGNVTGLIATIGNGRIILSWTNPAEEDFAGVRIVFSVDAAPASIDAGTQIYEGKDSTFIHTGLTNGTTYFYTAFAYDESGNFASGVSVSATPAELLWARTIDMYGGHDYLYGVTIDSQDNVVAAGYYDPDPDTTDEGSTCYLVKLDSLGNQLWDDSIEIGPVGGSKQTSDERLYDVGVDAQDNIYVAGQISGTFISYTMGSYHTGFLVRKYDADGTLQWEDIWQESGNSPWQKALCLDFDSSGNLYVGGNAFGAWGTILGEWAIRKYSSAGTSLWEPSLYYDAVQGIVDLNEACRNIVIDDENNIIGCGHVGVSYPDSSSYDYNWHVRKYSPDTTLLWSYTYAGTQNLNDQAFSVDTDSAGDVFVAGYVNNGISNSGGESDYDWLVMKFSKDGSAGDGVVLWTYQYETEPGSSEGCYALLVDDDDNVLVAGSTIDSVEERTLRIVKLSNEDGSEIDEFIYPVEYGVAPWSIYLRGNKIALAGTIGNGNDNDLLVMCLELP